MKKFKDRWMYIFLSGLITCITLVVLLALNGFKPFGQKSLACFDANIQYLDFYCYFKDVIAGKNDIFYSFSKTLGGTNIAIFSYYLSSPFILLSLFFDKSQMNTYFNITIVLKLTVASMTFCYFLFKRFESKIRGRGAILFTVLLAVAYSLSQYSIAQANNIMWLDGVYMLPLILLAVYKVIQGESSAKLSIFVGYSIFVNWYIAGINCLFSGIWFLTEYLLNISRKLKVKDQIKDFLYTSIRYVSGMLLGVMLSAFLFLPTIKALQNSSRGELNLEQFFGMNFTGHIGSVIQNYSYGASSSYGSVALFCGALALIGVISFFVNKYESKYKRIILGGALIFNLMCYYFVPLYMIFSLFKVVGSYWYRYSHLGIFIIIFIAAQYFIVAEKKDNFLPFKSGLVFASLLLILDSVNPVWDMNLTILTSIMFIIIGAIVSSIYCFSSYKQVCAILLTAICLLDYSNNAKILLNIYSIPDVNVYYAYTKNQSKMIDEIKQFDDSIYRVSQTSTRDIRSNGLTANYNEGLAYSYWSISGYTSSPDDNQREFLEKLGYRRCGENLCVVNTSILGADSILGVKYVMSKKDINGLNKIESLNSFDGKYVYENPYSLPMALVYTESDNSKLAQNSFDYQNGLYSELAGKEADIYDKLEYDVEVTEKEKIYTIHIPEGNYSIYGDIPWSIDQKAVLSVNENYSTSYAGWMSPSTFYVPTNSSDNTAVVVLESDNLNRIIDEKVCFYALNLDKLKIVTDKLKEGEPKEYKIANGNVKVNVPNALKNQKLFLSIPYDKGWIVSKNGKPIDVSEEMLLGECLYAIPLDEGDNQIEMTYHVAGLKEGICISLLSIVILVSIFLYRKNILFRNRRNDSDEER